MCFAIVKGETRIHHIIMTPAFPCDLTSEHCLGSVNFFPLKLSRFLSSLATNLARTSETWGFMLGTYVRQGSCNDTHNLNNNMYTL